MKQKGIAFKKQLLAHEGFRRYGANTAWLMGEKILRMFVGLFVGVWIARYLGPEQFGLLSYAQSFVFLFTAVATLGLDGIVVRELVKTPEQAPELLGTAFGLKLMGALCILPLLWVGVQFTSNDDYTNLLIFIIASATIFQSFNVIDFYYQSTVMSKYVSLANVISLALSSIVKIVLVLNEAPLIAFALTVVFDAIVLAAGLAYFYFTKVHNKIGPWSYSSDTAIILLKYSYPLLIGGVMFVTFSKVDQLFISFMLGNKVLGNYAASSRIVESLYFIPIVLVNSFLPALVNSKKVSNTLYISRMRKFVFFTLIALSLISFTFFIIATPLMNMLYGQGFSSVDTILKIQIWLLVITGVGYINGTWLINEGLEKYTMYNYTLAALLNVALNYIFIKKYGVLGSVYASLISQFLVYYILLWFRKDTRVLVSRIYGF